MLRFFSLIALFPAVTLSLCTLCPDGNDPVLPTNELIAETCREMLAFLPSLDPESCVPFQQGHFPSLCGCSISDDLPSSTRILQQGCKVCLNGSYPKNPKATVADAGGYTCQYIYDNSNYIAASGPQCLAIHKSVNQNICGCSAVAPVTRGDTPSPATIGVPTRRPTTRPPVSAGGQECKVCLNGGRPKNLNVAIAALGGYTCQYFYDNPSFSTASGQKCVAIHRSANQALCGCPTSASTAKPTTITRGDTPSPAIIVVSTRRPTTRRPTTRSPVSAGGQGCNVCLNGSYPRNPNAIVTAVGGFTCQYFYDNSDSVTAGGQQCQVIHMSVNQNICGCS